MARIPFTTGDLIYFMGEYATVVKDFGMATLVVRSAVSGEDEIWTYDLNGRKCVLVHPINDGSNKVMVKKVISDVDGVVTINIDIKGLPKNEMGELCRIVLNENTIWDNSI